MSSSGEVKQSRKNIDSIYHAGYDEDLKPIPMEKYFHPKTDTSTDNIQILIKENVAYGMHFCHGNWRNNKL